MEHTLQHPLGLIHVIFAVLAIIFGAVVIFMRKGTVRHRWIGRAYLFSMLALNGTAFMIYELFGGFGTFHWMAVISLGVVLYGYIPTWKKRPGWKAQHAFFMAGSYVGVIAALAAETITRYSPFPFWWSVWGATILVTVFGVRLMLRRIPRLL